MRANVVLGVAQNSACAGGERRIAAGERRITAGERRIKQPDDSRAAHEARQDAERAAKREQDAGLTE